MTLLSKGLRWMRDKLPEAAAETVELRAYGEVIDALSAIPGNRNFRAYSMDDYEGTEEVFDWIVVEQDLIIAGSKREPEAGWELRYRLEDGRTAIFVALPTSGTRCFDVLDQLGLMYRIHTKLERIEAS